MASNSLEKVTRRTADSCVLVLPKLLLLFLLLREEEGKGKSEFKFTGDSTTAVGVVVLGVGDGCTCVLAGVLGVMEDVDDRLGGPCGRGEKEVEDVEERRCGT